MAKCDLKQFKSAILDLTKAIQLNAKDAIPYYYRGIAKKNIGQKNGACADFSKAGELGYAAAYDEIKKNCQ